MGKAAEKQALALAALTDQPPVSLLVEPLDYIFADHFRQRVLCTVLDEMAAGDRGALSFIEKVLVFLRRDFGLHVLDEEEDLFPLLRRRAQTDDRIGDILGELSAEHASDKRDCEAICSMLEGGLAAKSDWKELFRRFAANERHHLIVENAIVLPLARARLTEADLSSLGRRMAARRGIEYPGAGRA